MNRVYLLYMFCTNYAIADKHVVYQHLNGIFSSLTEAESAMAALSAERYKYESVDEDGIDNIRVISFQIFEEPLNVPEINCTENIFIYNADAQLVEKQYGRGYGSVIPYRGKAENETAYNIGEIVYADIHANLSCELAVIIGLPMSTEEANPSVDTFEGDVYKVCTTECKPLYIRPNDIYPIVIPLSDNQQRLYSLISKNLE